MIEVKPVDDPNSGDLTRRQRRMLYVVCGGIALWLLGVIVFAITLKETRLNYFLAFCCAYSFWASGPQ